ncbi:MAG: oxidoreductase [Actinophytocola sp.]|uniref:ferredoxin reductase n=1 Tax=Actinophytocola sp. TaxID=1872138 RepID=UPI001326157F|nr:ferredoxin reductase [Actinophytocola sp.]MPZ82401.1 oxidoreductase [Actinophytocola sp.]
MLRWLVATAVDIREVTPTARTVVFEVPGWPGHAAGQHVDVKLTAPDGYSAQRSYSVAAPTDGDRVELTIQRVADGEVSPYLVGDLVIGDQIELRGPIGGWFAWHGTETMPVLLVAGGSGIVPLMAMVRARARVANPAEFKLLYSVRTPAEVYYDAELRSKPGLEVTVLFTRKAFGTNRPAGRIGAADLAAGWPPDAGARTYVCGPTGFVESVTQLLLAGGHDPASIRTERFGPSGG